MKNFYLFLLLAIFLNACNLSSKKNTELIKLFPVQVNEKWGYVDTKGALVIPVQFQEADIFSEGLARVGIEKDSVMYYGFINDKGELIIAPQYKDVTCFSEKIAWAVKAKGHPIAIDNTGKELFTMIDAEYVSSFSEGYASFSKVNSKGESKWGFCDKKGEVVIFPTFEKAHDFSEGLAVVSDISNKYGYIDMKGNMIIPYQFDKATDFQDGIASVRLGDKWGLIDKKGKIILNPQFDYLKIIDDNFIICKISDQIGFCDKTGKIIINPQFDDINYKNQFDKKQLFAIKQDKKWGYVNKSGEIKIKPQFEKAGMFQDDIAPVVFNGKVGLINEKGEYIVNPRYDSLTLNKNATLRTQFFNPTNLVNLIDLTNHKGISLDASFFDIMKKYHLVESDFSKYSNLTEINDEMKLSSDYLMQYYIIGSPYREYRQGYYYTWTEYEFSPDRKIDGILCSIGLFSNAKGRGDDILSEIEKNLNTYELVDKSTSDKIIKIFNSSEQSVLIVLYNETKDIQVMGIYFGNKDFVEKYYKVHKDLK